MHHHTTRFPNSISLFFPQNWHDATPTQVPTGLILAIQLSISEKINQNTSTLSGDITLTVIWGRNLGKSGHAQACPSPNGPKSLGISLAL